MPWDAHKTTAIVWGLNTLPGRIQTPLTPDKIVPLPPVPVPDAKITPADEPVQVSGAFLTAPVQGDYGKTGFIYIDPNPAIGYQYTADGSPFKSVIIPSPLPGGDSDFLLRFGDHTVGLSAGTEFDFTSVEPAGISQFFLLGIDPGENLDPLATPAFVTGLKFVNEGVVGLRWYRLRTFPNLPLSSGWQVRAWWPSASLGVVAVAWPKSKKHTQL